MYKVAPCCTCWINLPVEGPFVCILWCPLFPAGCSSRRGVWGHTTVSCTSAREPGWSSCPLSIFRGNVNNGVHWFLLSCSFSSLRLSCLRPSLCSPSLLCVREDVKLAQSCLSEGFALNVDVHSMCFCEEASSASTYTTILDSYLKILRY